MKALSLQWKIQSLNFFILSAVYILLYVTIFRNQVGNGENADNIKHEKHFLRFNVSTTTKHNSEKTTEIKNSYNLNTNHIKPLILTGEKRNQMISYVYNYIISSTHLQLEKYKSKLRNFLKSEKFKFFNISEQHEKVCSTCIIPRKLVRDTQIEFSKGKKHSPTLMLTAKPSGRLGNVMGEYATLFALGKLYNTSVFLNSEMNKKLPFFPNISIKNIFKEEKECFFVGKDNFIYNYAATELAAAGLLGSGCFILSDSPFEIQLFHRFRNDLVKEFTFSDSVQNQVKKFYQSVRDTVSPKENSSEHTFVGVHVRRTDYLKHIKRFGGKLPGKSYYNNAMQYFTEKYENVLFVVSSDDRKFIQNLFSDRNDVTFTSGESPEIDMAILNSCNHSIFTVGSYGFWSAYLTGGEVLYPNIKTNHTYRFTKTFYENANITNFIPINFDK